MSTPTSTTYCNIYPACLNITPYCFGSLGSTPRSIEGPVDDSHNHVSFDNKLVTINRPIFLVGTFTAGTGTLSISIDNLGPPLGGYYLWKVIDQPIPAPDPGSGFDDMTNPQGTTYFGVIEMPGLNISQISGISIPSLSRYKLIYAGSYGGWRPTKVNPATGNNYGMKAANVGIVLEIWTHNPITGVWAPVPALAGGTTHDITITGSYLEQ